MAKPTPITFEDMDVKKRPVGLSSPSRHFPRHAAAAPRRAAPTKAVPNDTQLQLRLPAEIVLGIKASAVAARQSISAYMLECYLARTKPKK